MTQTQSAPQGAIPSRRDGEAGVVREPQPAHGLAPSNRFMLTSQPVRRVMFLLALPVLGEQMLNTFVGLFDTFLAGKFGAAATAAVGLAAYTTWLAQLLVMLVGTGTTALVARLIGAGDDARANHVANQSMTLAGIVGLVALGTLYTLAPFVARYTNLTGDAARIAIEYLRVDAVGNAMTSLTLVGCAALRGAGDMRTPMLIFLAINALNVAASLLFVFGLGPVPALGVRGIVMGTVTAHCAGAILTLGILTRGRSGLQLHRALLRLAWDPIRRILRIGVPAGLDGALMWTGHFAFLAIVARLAAAPHNEAYLAAHMIAVRVEAMTYLPAFAWGSATATLIGQALGAKRPDRAMRAGYEGVLQCGILILALTVAFLFGASAIYTVMSNDPTVRAIGMGPFRVLALLQICMVVSIVLINGLHGAGDTRFPLVITAVGTAIRLTVGFVGGIVLGGGLLGAWTGMFADMIWRAAAALARFARGRWLETQV